MWLNDGAFNWFGTYTYKDKLVNDAIKIIKIFSKLCEIRYLVHGLEKIKVNNINELTELVKKLEPSKEFYHEIIKKYPGMIEKLPGMIKNYKNDMYILTVVGAAVINNKHEEESFSIMVSRSSIYPKQVAFSISIDTDELYKKSTRKEIYIEYNKALTKFITEFKVKDINVEPHTQIYTPEDKAKYKLLRPNIKEFITSKGFDLNKI